MSLFTSAFAALSRRLLAGGSSHVLGAAQTFLRQAARRLVDEAVERLKKKAVPSVAATALAVVAAGSLASALTEGLIALGVPPWAAHLALAAVAGVASWACFARGGSRSVMKTEDSRRESESDASSHGVTIKIVNEVHRPRPSRKKRRVHSRPSRSRKNRPSKAKPRKTVRVRVAAPAARKKSTKPRPPKRRIVRSARAKAA
jgi:hypothetical protein